MQTKNGEEPHQQINVFGITAISIVYKKKIDQKNRPKKLTKFGHYNDHFWSILAMEKRPPVYLFILPLQKCIVLDHFLYVYPVFFCLRPIAKMHTFPLQKCIHT